MVRSREQREADPERPEQEERLEPPVAGGGRKRDADDEGIGGVDARHRRIRVGEHLNDPGAVIECL